MIDTKSLNEPTRNICLGFPLMKNHAFLDGNKRVSMLCMLTFLEVNGVRLGYSDDALYNLAIGLANGTLDYDYLVNWIKRHKLKDYEGCPEYET